MSRPPSVVLGVVLAILGSSPCLAQLQDETIRRTKRATALVEVSTQRRAGSGSAFCVDKSGLFITNAHVVEIANGTQASIHLVLDIGLDSQRSLKAEVLRHDDRVDLALLKADAQDGPALTTLELGDESALHELTEVFTFGYPFGRAASIGKALYPDVTVLGSRITSLQKTEGKLREVQFNNQLNPGNSGGPVVDASGKVVGVAVATVRAASLNMAIPVSNLADFLTAPGLVFDPPPVVSDDRDKPVTWQIHLQPPRPGAKIPEGLSVTITVPDEARQPSVFAARPTGDGVYEAKVIPTPRAPWRRVDIVVKHGQDQKYLEVRLKDDDVVAAGSKLISSALRLLFGGSSLPRQSVRGLIKTVPGLGVGTSRSEPRTVGVMDLSMANEIAVQPINWPFFRALMAQVEAKQGSRIVATIRRRVPVNGPYRVLRPGTNVIVSLPRPVPSPFTYGPPDQGRLDLGGVLDVGGVPVGAGESIHPPKTSIPEAQLSTSGDAIRDSPLVRKLDGRVSDVAVGGGGRYLLLTLSDARKLAVFDTNLADVVKTIPLPSPNAIVAAGASKFLIAFPDQKLIQRWDLPSLRREGGSRTLPIKGPLKALVMGSDSNGPALAFWAIAEDTNFERTVFSFIDVNSLKAVGIGLVASWATQGSVSASGGSFQLPEFANNPGLKSEPLHIRASAAGALYTIWDTSRIPTGFQTLIAQGKILKAIYKNESPGHLIPGGDGLTVFSGRMGRLDVDGNVLDREAEKRTVPPEPSIPSCDAAYYLRISGLVWTDPAGRQGPTAASGGVRASVHDAESGTRLLTVVGLSEMADLVPEDRRPDYSRLITDFTIEKRFHLIPAAGLLITIPAANDRLVLRRLNLEEALGRAGDDYLIVTSTRVLAAKVGQKLEHQIVARSKQGDVSFSLVKGPQGLSITPEGKLAWLPPQAVRGENLTVALNVKSTSGQERIHQLQISIK
jgi:Trypsin-like peptidase domain